LWKLTRGDFYAEWDPSSRRGRIHQSANPYSIDAVLRIVHTLVLAGKDGFLGWTPQARSARPRASVRGQVGRRQNDDHAAGAA
jgi:hypothetical protein